MSAFLHDFLLSVLPPKDAEKFDTEGKRIPSVTLSFAQSLDGKIAGSKGKQLILSDPESMLMTHWMRAMHDAILVGIGTALNDDPQLNVRLISSADRLDVRSPRPVILDSRLRLPTNCKLLKNYRDGKGQQPWVFCALEPATSASVERDGHRSALEAAGAIVYEIPCVSGILSVPSLLQRLYELGIRSIMVEGGATVIGTFMNHASRPDGPPLVDALVITVAPMLVGDDGIGYTIGSFENKQSFTHLRTERMGKDTIVAGKFT